MRVVLVPTSQPVAIPGDKINDRPLNLVAGAESLLLFRDPQTTRIRAFSRDIGAARPLSFKLNKDRRRKQPLLLDVDTNSGWSADARAIDGPLAHESRRLTPLLLEEGLYWGIMKYWFPDLILADPDEAK
jgi:hypothetical protein